MVKWEPIFERHLCCLGWKGEYPNCFVGFCLHEPFHPESRGKRTRLKQMEKQGKLPQPQWPMCKPIFCQKAQRLLFHFRAVISPVCVFPLWVENNVPLFKSPVIQSEWNPIREDLGFLMSPTLKKNGSTLTSQYHLPPAVVSGFGAPGPNIPRHQGLWSSACRPQGPKSHGTVLPPQGLSHEKKPGKTLTFHGIPGRLRWILIFTWFMK